MKQSAVHTELCPAGSLTAVKQGLSQSEYPLFIQIFKLFKIYSSIFSAHFIPGHCCRDLLEAFHALTGREEGNTFP